MIIITRDSEVIMVSPCAFVCVFGCVFVTMLVRIINYKGMVPLKQHFAWIYIGVSSCVRYNLRTHDVINDVTRLKK